MSLVSPRAGWFKPPVGAERTWIGIALIWCLVLFAMMPYWHFRGKQNATGLSYRVTPKAFAERVTAFTQANQVGKEKGVPVVEPAPGSDIYLQARMWDWSPILKLKAGQTYRLHLSSLDLQHGFSLKPMNMNFQVLPGYDYVLTITPTEKGTYEIICNEFCGIGHHLMTGRMIVE